MKVGAFVSTFNKHSKLLYHRAQADVKCYFRKNAVARVQKLILGIVPLITPGAAPPAFFSSPTGSFVLYFQGAGKTGKEPPWKKS